MMRLILRYIAILIFASASVFAHNKTILGIVKTNDGDPIISATVRIEGTVLGTMTDKNGKFILKKIPDGKHNLKISAIGYETINKEIELQHHEGDEYMLDFTMVENPVQTSNVVITANRGEKIYEDVPIKVSTITEKEFQISTSNNIREGLQYQPGVRTEVNCQNCGFSQVRINGLEGKYSQILIDGKAVFSSLNGVYGLEQIPTNMIERVEVVRGGGSSLYGGNAIAGVINIITKEPCFDDFNISWNNFSVNSKVPENSVSINSSFVNDNQNLGVTIFGMLNDRQEFDANNDGFSEIGKMDVATFGSKFFWKNNSTSKFTLEFHNINHTIRGGNKLDMEPHQSDITEYAKHKTFLGQLNYETFINDHSKLNAYLSAQTTKRDSYYGANQDLNAYGTTDNTTYAACINYNLISNAITGNHVVIFGLDYNNDYMLDKAPSYNRVIDQNVNSFGFYLQDDWSINQYFNVLLGIRADKHNLIDDMIINPRASILSKLTDKLSLRMTYSTGYRAPQAFDEDLHITQVNGEGFVITLNDNLKPEYSHSISGSLDYSFELFAIPMAMSVEYFNTKLNDVFVMTDVGEDGQGNRILERQNGESATVNGMTFEIQSSTVDYLVKFGLTYQSSLYSEQVEWSSAIAEENIEAQYSDKIFKTPDLYGFLLASYNVFENIKVEAAAYYTGKMYLPHYAGYIEKDELKETDTFLDANLKFVYTIQSLSNINIGLGLMNIFNQYQNDFDLGVNRDAGYMYGPFRPFTTMLSLGVNF